MPADRNSTPAAGSARARSCGEDRTTGNRAPACRTAHGLRSEATNRPAAHQARTRDRQAARGERYEYLTVMRCCGLAEHPEIARPKRTFIPEIGFAVQNDRPSAGRKLPAQVLPRTPRLARGSLADNRAARPSPQSVLIAFRTAQIAPPDATSGRRGMAGSSPISSLAGDSEQQPLGRRPIAELLPQIAGQRLKLLQGQHAQILLLADGHAA